jgi:hypothetical protein
MPNFLQILMFSVNTVPLKYSGTQKSQFIHKTLLNHPHCTPQPPRNASYPHTTPGYSKNQSLYFCLSLFLHLEAKTTIATKL